MRRFSSLCFATIKTPQSSSLSTEDAVMNPREVARVARRCIEIAHDRLRQGDALLVFAEGTRSRTTGLQQTLSAVSRYLDGPDVHLLPAGIVGSEAMFPIGEDALYAVHVVARVGRPILASALRKRAGGDRRLMMDAVGLAIAATAAAGLSRRLQRRRAGSRRSATHLRRVVLVRRTFQVRLPITSRAPLCRRRGSRVRSLREFDRPRPRASSVIP